MAKREPEDRPLQHALKEWAAVCLALAEGRQALLLRKGGIADSTEGFRLEHTGFWLYPTYTHQQVAGIRDDARPLLEQAESGRPPAGAVRVSHFALVVGAYQLHDMVGVLRLRDLHVWTDETVHARFAYRQPGLLALAVRVYRSREVQELPELGAYAGCKSWVELERALPTEGATAVLGELEFSELMRKIDRLLNPAALA
jgi:hypothetical protein